VPETPNQPAPLSPQGQTRARRRLWPGFRALLKTRIVAGLLTVVPICVTWVVVKFVFDAMRFMTQPIAQSVAKSIVERNKAILPSKVETYVDWIVPVMAVLLTLFFLYLLGLLSANVVGRRLIHMIETLFAKLPLIKTIYRSTKQVVTTLGGGQSQHFQRVVLVESPRTGMKCIGFLTSVMTDSDTGRQMANVFIATTPNPAVGYMQIVPLEAVSETGWTVEEAIKLLMSGGILSPPTVPFDRIHPVRWVPEPAKPVQTAPSRQG